MLEGTGYDANTGESAFISGPVREFYGEVVTVSEALVDAPIDKQPDVFVLMKKHFQRAGWTDRADGTTAVGEDP